jgi:hypothetical protein
LEVLGYIRDQHLAAHLEEFDYFGLPFRRQRVFARAIEIIHSKTRTNLASRG